MFRVYISSRVESIVLSVNGLRMPKEKNLL